MVYVVNPVMNLSQVVAKWLVEEGFLKGTEGYLPLEMMLIKCMVLKVKFTVVIDSNTVFLFFSLEFLI
jgi:hypothetical protein